MIAKGASTLLYFKYRHLPVILPHWLSFNSEVYLHCYEI